MFVCYSPQFTALINQPASTIIRKALNDILVSCACGAAMLLTAVILLQGAASGSLRNNEFVVHINKFNESFVCTSD